MAAPDETPAVAVNNAIRIRARLQAGGTDVLVLMPHPMETGLRQDGSGGVLPAHFITSVRISAQGRTVLEARMSIAVAQDPLLRFRFRGGAVGDRISVAWVDNLGQQRTGEALTT